MDKKRLTAVKTNIGSMSKGKFFAQEGFNPSYVLSPAGQRLSRVRVLATAVDKFVSGNGKFASLTLDDGTDTIRVKVFNALSMIEKIEKGNLIDVIARIKQYQEEVYLLPEIITKIDDPNMELLRQLEIQEQETEARKKKQLILEYKSQVADYSELVKFMKERFGIEQEEIEACLQQDDVPKTQETRTEIIKMIETLDAGEGCDYQELIQAAGVSENVLDVIVGELLEEGLVFEPRPGKIKKL
jgi:RPA family protein